jgi:3'-phosphoadenosine 5'-phosphosulfate sulfotransferase (PAPS reductase)/FAD synthetase
MNHYDNYKIVVSMSGGKDSTAMCLNLLEQGYSPEDFTRVFIDTGWEDSSTYEYLRYLEKKVGKIQRLKAEIPIREEDRSQVKKIEDMLGFPSAMVRLIYKNRMFPSGARKWCTPLLKIEPLKEFFTNLDQDAVNLVGIRREESPRRASYTEWEYSDTFECYTHRPLINWTEKQVIDIHTRNQVEPNNLYLKGFSRVGCYPCIYTRKKEINLLTENRIEVIRLLEADIGNTYFKQGNIDYMLEWSKTSRGGRQYQLFNLNPPSCEKWGLCDMGL